MQKPLTIRWQQRLVYYEKALGQLVSAVNLANQRKLFVNANPTIAINYINANDDVTFMITRGIANCQSD